MAGNIKKNGPPPCPYYTVPLPKASHVLMTISKLLNNTQNETTTQKLVKTLEQAFIYIITVNVYHHK